MEKISKLFILILLIICSQDSFAYNRSFFVDVSHYKGTISTIEEVIKHPNFSSKNNFYENSVILEKNNSKENDNIGFKKTSEYCANLNSYNSISPLLSYQEKFWLIQSSRGVYDECGKISNSKILARANLLNEIINKDQFLSRKYKNKYPMISFVDIVKNKKDNKVYYETLLLEIDNLRDDLLKETNGEIINQYLFENINIKLKSSSKSVLSNEEEKFYLHYLNKVYSKEKIKNIFYIPKFNEIKHSNNNKINQKIKFLEDINPLLYYFLERQNVKKNKVKQKLNIKDMNTKIIHELSLAFNNG